MKPTRRTQPMRKGPGRVPGGGLAAALRGRTFGGYNPQDARRKAQRGGGFARVVGQAERMPQRRRPATRGGGLAKAVELRASAPTKKPKPLDMAAPGMSVSAAQRKARKVSLSDRKAEHETTAGKRRLSFDEAYLRRSTDSSRARVEKRYGKTASEKLKRQATGPKARITDPVPADQVGPKAPPRTATSGSGFARVLDRKKRARRG